LYFSILLVKTSEGRSSLAPSLWDSGLITGFANPTLKRGADNHCTHGAGMGSRLLNSLDRGPSRGRFIDPALARVLRLPTHFAIKPAKWMGHGASI
jgi:hypothetical protein